MKIDEGYAMHLILKELDRARILYPDATWPDDVVHQVSIMAEEAGEALRAALNLTYHGGTREELVKELVQTGAMVVRCLKAVTA